MNILAGQFGGRNIKTSSKLGYRPTLSRVRKSIFDTLNPFHYDSVFDLFSGSGIFGFECASRGARSITFVENNYHTFSSQKNSEILSGPQYKFLQKDAYLFLGKTFKYDLIFADPPYSKYDIESLAETHLKHLNKNGKFILECDRGQMTFLDAVEKDFGDTKILYWRDHEEDHLPWYI